jgi:hypothetical protein
MGEERLVFGRDEGLDQALGHLSDGNKEAALLGIFGQQRSVGGMDARHDRRFIGRKLLVVGQVLGRIPDEIGEPARKAEEQHKSDCE